MNIEITKEVADKFLSDNSTIMSMLNSLLGNKQNFDLPSEKVELRVYNFLSTVEQIKRDSADIISQANRQQRLLLEKVYTNYVDSDILITCVKEKEHIHILAKSLFTHPLLTDNKLIEFAYSNGSIEILFWSANNLHQSKIVANKIVRLLEGVLDHLNAPTTVKKVESIKIPKIKKKRSKGKKTNVKYVYKTVYKVTDVNLNVEQSEIKTPYKEREYLKEEWQRKGHYRFYRDKETGEVVKKVWIKPATCKAKGKIRENQNYKITKIN